MNGGSSCGSGIVKSSIAKKVGWSDEFGERFGVEVWTITELLVLFNSALLDDICLLSTGLREFPVLL